MKHFLDTEFTDLRRGQSRLISLGLVAENGREFYRELPADTYLVKASAFVRQTVLPLLLGGRFEVTSQVLCTDLREWFAEYDYVEIVTDAPSWDFHFLQSTLAVDGRGWPANLAPAAVFFDPTSVDAALRVRSAFAHYFIQPGHFAHNALHDAHALRLAWLAMKRRRPPQ